MTAQHSQLPTNNPYNLYNFVPKNTFSRTSIHVFSQEEIARLRDAAPCEQSNRLDLIQPAVTRLGLNGLEREQEGGDFSC